MTEKVPARAEEAHSGGKESPEVFERLRVKIVEPDRDKNFMVGFGLTSKTGKYSKEQLDAYTYAIETVLEEAGLRPFHQVGSGYTDGVQLWEVHKETNRGNLENLMTSIQIMAGEYAEEMKNLRVSERVDEVINS